MNLNKIPKSLYLVLILLMVTIGVIVILEKKTPANNSIKTPASSTIESTASTSPVSTSEMNTSSWKTYINEKYGFEIRYPIDFTLIESTAGIKFLSPEDVQLSYLPHAPYSMFIFPVKEVSPEVTFIDWIESEIGFLPNRDLKEFTGKPSDETNYIDIIEKVVFGQDKLQGYRIHQWIQSSEEWNYFARNDRGNKMVRILRGVKGIEKIDDPIFQEMLSTFRFLH